MPLINRMNRLKELFRIRVGPGAATLPGNVTRIHLLLATKYDNGHLGPRRFWRQFLPRLKYHNPGVSMTVDRVKDQSSPATMTIYFSSDTSATNVSPLEKQQVGEVGGAVPTSTTSHGTERQEVINIQHKKETEIYESLLKATNGEAIQPSEEEIAETKRLEQEAIEKAIDSKKKKDVMNKLKEEARSERMMLEAAKASA